MSFDQEQFNQFIIDNKVIGFFEKPITLKSGKQSHFYVNWRSVTEDVYTTYALTQYILSFIKSKNLSPDCFYGVPEGATKIAILTQDKWARSQPTYAKYSHSLPMGRGKPKEGHGNPKDKYFLGEPKGKIIILEDVTTTGGSLLSEIDKLQKMNKTIPCAIGLTNRNEILPEGKTIDQEFQRRAVAYYAMSNALDLLPHAYQMQKPGVDIGRLVEEECRIGDTLQVKLL